MKEINLRKFYPEIYKEDYIVTLPNEIVEVLIDARRKETAHRIRTYRYKAYYSLDQGDNIESFLYTLNQGVDQRKYLK